MTKVNIKMPKIKTPAMLEQEELNILSNIAKQKTYNSIENISDTIISFEDPDMYWAEMDGIHLGTKKHVWAVEMDEDLIAVFIGQTFDELKSELEALPNKPTDAEIKAAFVEAKKLIPYAIKFRMNDDTNASFECDEDTNKMHGTVINGIRFGCSIRYRPTKRKAKVKG